MVTNNKTDHMQNNMSQYKTLLKRVKTEFNFPSGGFKNYALHSQNQFTHLNKRTETLNNILNSKITFVPPNLELMNKKPKELETLAKQRGALPVSYAFPRRKNKTELIQYITRNNLNQLNQEQLKTRAEQNGFPKPSMLNTLGLNNTKETLIHFLSGGLFIDTRLQFNSGNNIKDLLVKTKQKGYISKGRPSKKKLEKFL